MGLLALLFAVTSNTLTMAIAARMLGLPVSELAVGLGPGIGVSLAPVRLRPRFVLGGWVRFREDEDGNPAPLPPVKRVALALAGAVPAVVVAAWLLGFEALAAAGLAPRDLLAGFSPFGAAQGALTEASALFSADPRRFAALLLVKTAVWNLLPIPPLGVGLALADLLPLRWRLRVSFVGNLVLLAWFACWLVALVTWLAS